MPSGHRLTAHRLTWHWLTARLVAAVGAGLLALGTTPAAAADGVRPEPGQPWFGPVLDWTRDLPADYAEQRIPFFDGWPPDMTTSMHHDLRAGKPLELRWLSGGVVDLGAQVGVPTPLNRAVRDILMLHAEGGAEEECAGRITAA